MAGTVADNKKEAVDASPSSEKDEDFVDKLLALPTSSLVAIFVAIFSVFFQVAYQVSNAIMSDERIGGIPTRFLSRKLGPSTLGVLKPRMRVFLYILSRSIKACLRTQLSNSTMKQSKPMTKEAKSKQVFILTREHCSSNALQYTWLLGRCLLIR